MLNMTINDLSERAKISITSALKENGICYMVSEKTNFDTYRITIDMKSICIESMVTSDNIIIINKVTGNIVYVLLGCDFVSIEII